MQALTQHSYANKMVSTLKRGSAFALVSMLVNLPFFLIMIAVGYAYGIMANNLFSATMLLPLLSIILLLIVGTRNALFAGFLPEVVSSDKSVFACLRNGIKIMKGHWGSVFSSSMLVSLIMFGGVVAISVSTLGAGLLIAIPSITVIKCSFWLVAHNSASKHRYYINENVIVNPL